MIKNLLITYLFLITNVFAGLPPTTVKGQAEAVKTTTFNVEVPYSQATTTAAGTRLLQTGNENMLVNPSFEGQNTSGVANGWTNVAGTATITTTASEISSGKQAQKIALSAQTLNFSQSVNTPAGIQKQGVVGILYKVPSAVSTFQVCSLVDGSEQTCVPSARLVLDNTYRFIEIPTVFGSTSAGIKLKTTGNVTGDVFFDAAYVKQGIGLTNLQLDTVYSAKVSATGVVSYENKDWINGNCNNPSTGLFNCNFESFIFTTAPNCLITPAYSSSTNGNATIDSTTSSNTGNIRIYQSGSLAPGTFNIICQKQGNDYLAASASVYSAASADTDWASCGHTTSDFTGFGTVTGIETQCKREGSDLLMRGKFTPGTTTGVEARLNLKLNGQSLTSAGSSVIPSLQQAGDMLNAVSSASFFRSAVLIEPSVGYVTFSAQTSTLNALTKRLGNDLASSTTLSIIARIPIQGWTDSGVIVGSFQGYNYTPNVDRVETFSVSYAGANAGTVTATNCTASTCNIDQIGNNVSTITRTSTGVYNLNLSKTMSSLKCSGNATSVGSAQVIMSEISCKSCSSVQFAMGSALDTEGSLVCQAIP